MEKQRGIKITNVDDKKQCDIYVVGGSKSQGETVSVDVEKISKTNPYRTGALIIVDKHGDYYQAI